MVRALARLISQQPDHNVDKAMLNILDCVLVQTAAFLLLILCVEIERERYKHKGILLC